MGARAGFPCWTCAIWCRSSLMLIAMLDMKNCPPTDHVGHGKCAAKAMRGQGWKSPCWTWESWCQGGWVPVPMVDMGKGLPTAGKGQAGFPCRTWELSLQSDGATAWIPMLDMGNLCRGYKSDGKAGLDSHVRHGKPSVFSRSMIAWRFRRTF